MEKFDFVIQDLVTGDYYYYFSGDPEFDEGWRLGNLFEALGFETEDDAWHCGEVDELTQFTIRKRTTHVMSESI
ncbi:hypothetical protein ENTB43_095 [Enterobacter phage Entb_43]|nr:hypothetical protein ENTB43_095 [Enterobacter phage Entb_43]